MLAITMTFKTCRPTTLTAVPSAMIRIATVAVNHRVGSPTPKICNRKPLAAYDSVPRAIVSPHM
jgi:hypothetical protein